MRATAKAGRRAVRHQRARARMAGTAERPRLSVYRSLKHIHAQIVDDGAGRTLVSASSQSPELRAKLKHGGNKAAAAEVGALIAARASAAGIKQVCFDRGGFRYHGVIAELATAARKAGLEF